MKRVTKDSFQEGRRKDVYPTRRIKDNSETIYICEGYATGMSLDKIFDTSVVVAFDANNLKAVTLEIRKKYPNTPIVICADNDIRNKEKLGNTGYKKAHEAVMAINNVNAKVIYPMWTNHLDQSINESVDFNDVYCVSETEEIRSKITEAILHGGRVVKIKKSQDFENAGSNSNLALEKRQERNKSYE